MIILLSFLIVVLLITLAFIPFANSVRKFALKTKYTLDNKPQYIKAPKWDKNFQIGDRIQEIKSGEQFEIKEIIKGPQFDAIVTKDDRLFFEDEVIKLMEV